MIHLASKSIRLKRLRFRSWHRGCKETDLILGRFCDAALETMPESDLDTFEALLEENDADLWQWLSGKQPAPEVYHNLIQKVLNTPVVP